MKEINSQVHFLTINYDNEFIKIFNFLLEIERLISFTKKVSLSDTKWLELFPKDRKKIKDELKSFQGASNDILFDILNELVAKTNMNIISQEDRQVLYTKIIELQMKRGLSYGDFYFKNAEKVEWLILRLIEWRNILNKDKIINVNMRNGFEDLITRYERILFNFKKDFPDSKQKTAKRYEKLT